MNTKHASDRAQQRCFPPFVDELLDRFGREEHDSHGAVVVYLDNRSIKNMKRELGRQLVSRLSSWFDAYKVRSTDGLTITFGHRMRHVRRK